MTNVVERLFLVLLCLLCIFGDTSVKIFFPPFKKSVCFSSPLCILNASLLIGVRIYKCFLTVCGFFFFFFLIFLTCLYGEGNGTPLQYSCLENLTDGGAWGTSVHGVAKSWTWLSDFTFTFHFHALEKEMATHSSVLAWRIPGTGAWWAAIYGVAQSWTRLKWLSNMSVKNQ